MRDYKPREGKSGGKESRPWYWFVGGVALPLAVMAMVLPGEPDEVPQTAEVAVEVVAEPEAETPATETEPAEPEMVAEAEEPAAEPNTRSSDLGALTSRPRSVLVTEAVTETADAPIALAAGALASYPTETAEEPAAEVVAIAEAGEGPGEGPIYPTPDAQPLHTETVLTVRKGDSLDRLFRKNDLNLRDLAELMELDLAREHLRILRPGDTLTVRHDGSKVLGISRELDLMNLLVVNQDQSRFAASVVEQEIERRQVAAEGVVTSSLFGSAANAGVSDRLIMNMAGIFAWDIDFALEIREGDTFAIVYEELWRDGRKLADGEILAAEFINQGDEFRAIRFQKDDGRADYYSPDGRAMRKAFVRAPLEFSRISSNFNLKRRHPVLNKIRAHKGTDYAAPTGTPVKAAGDGKVTFKGVKGGYGNTVILQHGDNITTLYAHLNGFDRRLKNGMRVQQGQVIGFVGSSGLATGPHLHYEYRKNGVHLNPRTVKLPASEPISDNYMPQFKASAAPLLDTLDTRREQLALAN